MWNAVFPPKEGTRVLPPPPQPSFLTWFPVMWSLEGLICFELMEELIQQYYTVYNGNFDDFTLLSCPLETRQFVLGLWKFLHIIRLQQQHGIPASMVEELTPLPLVVRGGREPSVAEEIEVWCGVSVGLF